MKLLANTVSFLPGFVLWPFAKRYVAGKNLKDLFATKEDIESKGYSTTLSYLGEHCDWKESLEAYGVYGHLLHAHNAYISLKLSQFGVFIPAKTTDFHIIHDIKTDVQKLFYNLIIYGALRTC